VTPDRRTILALFSLAFGLRILYAVLVGTSAEVNPNPYTYDFLIARKIASGADWWSQPLSPAAPGYQLLLAALFGVGGVHRWLVIIAQAIFGGVTAYALFRMGEGHLRRGAGVLSAIWLSIYINHVHFTSVMVRDVTVTMLVVTVCYLLVRYTPRMRGAVWTALAYAVLVHFDPQYLLFLPVLTAYYLFFATRHKLLNVQQTFLFLGAVLVLLTPVTIRNYRLYGEPIPVALEATQFLQPVTSVFGGDDEPAGSGDAAASGPGLWHNSREFWRVVRIGETTEKAPGGATKVIPPWSLRHNVISLVTYGLLIPFFLWGVWVSFKERHRTGMVLAIAVVGVYLIAAFNGGSGGRRLPVEPFIILLAFYAIVDLYDRYRRTKQAD
jgi:4-amino-4-deoxy-L-arabinose transferase-like glycosyltransferase